MNVHDWIPATRARVLLALVLAATASSVAAQDAAREAGRNGGGVQSHTPDVRDERIVKGNVRPDHSRDFSTPCRAK